MLKSSVAHTHHNDAADNEIHPLPGHSQVLEAGITEHANEPLSQVQRLLALPLTSERAEAAMDTDGNIAVTLLLNKDTYLRYVVASTTGEGSTPEDYAHAAAFNFGYPRESAAEIIGCSGSDFVVSYTTHVREFLDD